MRAMTYRGPYKVRVEENDVPAVEHPNDAIVRVTLAAICGSDLHLYHGLMPDTRVGHTFGHEFGRMAPRFAVPAKAGERAEVNLSLRRGP
jgi:threonine dehydrogenase-like Zn-dependent dehydrogenase